MSSNSHSCTTSSHTLLTFLGILTIQVALEPTKPEQIRPEWQNLLLRPCDSLGRKRMWSETSQLTPSRHATYRPSGGNLLVSVTPRPSACWDFCTFFSPDPITPSATWTSPRRRVSVVHGHLMAAAETCGEAFGRHFTSPFTSFAERPACVVSG